ncbi:MAG: hypothetical protein AB8G96_00145 [Phycisphaerales bacterium]
MPTPVVGGRFAAVLVLILATAGCQAGPTETDAAVDAGADAAVEGTGDGAVEGAGEGDETSVDGTSVDGGSVDSASADAAVPAADDDNDAAEAPLSVAELGLASDPGAWTPLIDRVIARRGGIILVPIRPADAGADSGAGTGAGLASGSASTPASLPLPADHTGPVHLPVRIGGAPVAGLLAAIRPPRLPDWGPRGWTDKLPRAALTANLQPEVAGGPAPGVVLLVRTPRDGAGDLSIGGTTVTVTWAGDARMLDGAPPPRPTTATPPRADQPDPVDPHAYWRWRVLADVDGTPAPRPAGDRRTQYFARALADGWDAGLDRLARGDAAVARRVRETLSLRVDSPNGRVAAWPTRPRDLDALLERLLDLDRPLARIAADADAWTRTLVTVPVWKAHSGEDGNAHVAFMALNRSSEPQTITVSWPESGGAPAAITIPPRRLERVEVRRSGELSPNGFAEVSAAPGTSSTADAESGTTTGSGSRTGSGVRRDPVPLVRLAGPAADGSRRSPAPAAPPTTDRPRGGSPGPTLQAAWPGDRFGADPGDTRLLLIATEAGRRVSMSWEPALLPARPPGIDLRIRPEPTLADIERGAQVDGLSASGRGAEVRLRRRAGQWECFIEVRRPEGDPTMARLHIGRPDAGWTIEIPERGEIGLISAATSTDTLGATAAPPDVRRTSRNDRWFARVVLPDEWLILGRTALALELVPRDAPHTQLIAPGPVSPNGLGVGRVHIDLAVWDES